MATRRRRTTTGIYRPVACRVWNDRRVRALSERGKLLWLFLLTCPSLPIPGVIQAGPATIADQLGWSVESIRDGFAELRSVGLQVEFEDTLIWLPNALTYQPPTTPNQVRNWASFWDDVPEGELKGRIWQALKIACKSWSVIYDQLFGEFMSHEFAPDPHHKHQHKHQHDHKHEHQHQHEQREEAAPEARPSGTPPCGVPVPVPEQAPEQLATRPPEPQLQLVPEQVPEQAPASEPEPERAGASQAASPPRKPREAPRPRDDRRDYPPHHAQHAIDHFHRRYLVAYGCPPTWPGYVLKKFFDNSRFAGVDEVIRRIDRLFDGRGPRWIQEPFTSQILFNQWDALSRDAGPNSTRQPDDFERQMERVRMLEEKSESEGPS